jgi:capsular polysaccharide biosynthesis protein
MVNEAELESALRDRGFVIAEPEHLSVAEQIGLFRSAEIVVGATGAALANTLFLPPDAKLFEIQPINYQGIWVRALAQYVGARWHGYFCPSPLQERAVHIEGELRPGLDFSWAAPLPDFLQFLDRSLEADE